MSKLGGIGCDKARVDALEDQVVVDTAIIKAHNIEIKRLRNALDLYGEHLPDCGSIQVPAAPVCTCGLVQPPADSRLHESGCSLCDDPLDLSELPTAGEGQKT